MRFRTPLSLVIALAAMLVLASGAGAKGTPSNIAVTCGATVVSATVTVQLMSGVASPTPASNQLVLRCDTAHPIATGKITPFSQPAAAYAWSAFVTAATSTFGCGGTTARGGSVTCTNGAGGQGSVTINAS